VIHRDIKPSNIIIAADGTPFIMDFGIAREMKDTLTRVTGKGTSGTLPYMSPEQLYGRDPTPAQDIYSLAATIYECLTGHPPFWRGAIEHQIDHDLPEPLVGVSGLASGVMSGLAKDPSQRPSTCQGLIRAEIAATSVSVTGYPWVIKSSNSDTLTLDLGQGHRQRDDPVAGSPVDEHAVGWPDDLGRWTGG
jgi:serine/threonine protein kinase